MNDRPLAIVILAAGEGKRMKSALPKVMHPVAGLPMIGWVLKAAEAMQPQTIITVIGPDAEDVRKTVHPYPAVVQETRNGTAGALRCALPLLQGFDGDVLVLLGDVPLITPHTLNALLASRHEDERTGLSVLGMRLDDPAGYGRLILDGRSKLLDIVEERDASAQQKSIHEVNTGAFCIDGTQLERWLGAVDNKNMQGEYYLTDLPAIAAQDGAIARACIAADAGELEGCNTPVELARLEGRAQNMLRMDLQHNGVMMTSPDTVFVQHDTKIAPGVMIEPNVIFGPGVEIESGSIIRGFSYLEGTKIGPGNVIGPYARLRPGSVLGADVRIGNFVEIKKSTLGARSKINHLAYVGDCIMAEDVNFSAGAITVNYDGFQKHETIIGKGVMVGSNVNLVAPLTIDDGAFIAAGSTITEDVPADALSIGRGGPAEIRKGWAAEYRKRKKALLQKLAKSRK